MLDAILPVYGFLLTYAEKLVEDIPDERLAEEPIPGRPMNHAAWILGHLAWANENMVGRLNKPRLYEDWGPMMGMNSTPIHDRGRYPSKADLLAALRNSHGRLLESVRSATDAELDAPSPERMRARFPTLRHMAIGLMTSHFASHLGQLSAWRRACGHKSVF